jgi:hypothetical protein
MWATCEPPWWRLNGREARARGSRDASVPLKPIVFTHSLIMWEKCLVTSGRQALAPWALAAGRTTLRALVALACMTAVALGQPERPGRAERAPAVQVPAPLIRSMEPSPPELEPRQRPYAVKISFNPPNTTYNILGYAVTCSPARASTRVVSTERECRPGRTARLALLVCVLCQALLSCRHAPALAEHFSAAAFRRRRPRTPQRRSARSRRPATLSCLLGSGPTGPTAAPWWPVLATRRRTC